MDERIETIREALMRAQYDLKTSGMVGAPLLVDDALATLLSVESSVKRERHYKIALEQIALCFDRDEASLGGDVYASHLRALAQQALDDNHMQNALVECVEQAHKHGKIIVGNVYSNSAPRDDISCETNLFCRGCVHETDLSLRICDNCWNGSDYKPR